MFRRSRTFPDAPSRNARAPSRSRARRPSLALWRHRHLVVALCLGAAVALALSVLRPGQESGREVLVAARTIGAGEVIAAEDLTTRALPPDALPADGLAGPEVIGSRAAIKLEKGTAVTTSMTSAARARARGGRARRGHVPGGVGAPRGAPGAAVKLETATAVPTAMTRAARAGDLGDGERLVQVPVEVGAQLAEPGARVDVIGEVAIQEPDDSAGSPTFYAGPRTDVLCRGARVVLSTTEGEDGGWAAGRKVTLITLAVPAANANLIVSAATNGALGVVLSP